MSKNSIFKRSIAYICICIAVVSTAITITMGVNYFLSRNNISFSAKSADIYYVEYTDGETYKCKISKTRQDKYRYDYALNIEIENITDEAFDDWNLDIDFLQKVNLLENWNVSVATDDNTFSITPTDENKVIEAGKVKNFGFLVSAKNEIYIESIKISFDEL